MQDDKAYIYGDAQKWLNSLPEEPCEKCGKLTIWPVCIDCEPPEEFPKEINHAK